LMKYSVKKSRFRFRFDFEIGYLIKSPCRECDRRKNYFPTCSYECVLLDKIQTVLASSISSTKNP
jgi:hypothetical protein